MPHSGLVNSAHTGVDQPTARYRAVMALDVEMPGVGTFVLDERLGWLVSVDRFTIEALGTTGVWVIDDPEASPDVVVPAMRRFHALTATAVAQATPHVFAYYQDCVGTGWSPDVDIVTPDDVWQHVRMPDEFTISVDDGIAYVSLECECDWEVEHGLGLVFRDGDQISKVGQYDGHLHHTDRDEVYPRV